MWWGLEHTKMENASYHGKDWTLLKVPRVPMADRLTTYCVLLVGEVENDEGDREPGCWRCRQRINGSAVVPKGCKKYL
jgi:hypothetical protein